MICERGGCPGSGGDQTNPVYPFLMLAAFVAVVVAGRWLGWIG